MSGCLLDTNVLSELRKEQRCDAGVRRWLEETAEEELFLSVLVLGEIRQGIERIRLRDPAQARALEKWLVRIAAEFADRLLPVDERVADQWGDWAYGNRFRSSTPFWRQQRWFTA